MDLPDVLVTTTMDAGNQMKLAERYLAKHDALSYAVKRESEEAGTLHVTSAFEFLEFTFRNHQALTLFMSSFAVAAGVKMAGLLGKVVEAGASELGKDLYQWVKESLHRAIQDSKEKDARLPIEYRLGELRVIIRGVILDRVPFFAYIYNRYADIHSSKQLLVDDSEVTNRASIFFGFILPLVTYLLTTSPVLMNTSQPEMNMASDVANRDGWHVWLPRDVRLEVLPTKRFEVKSVNDNAELENLVRKGYQEFLDASQSKIG